MKTHHDIQHEGTVASDGTRMFFDKDSVAHLMSVLIDIYSDPALAVIREYSTNALDSHVAAGNPAPIEIELPSALKQMFVVRDHGLGMSVADVHERYAAYGYSSKRETNEQTGMLGLGCKSGLTYTSQFTIKTVKDGEEAIILVTRDADGCGEVKTISTRLTLDHNGVEITIPVKDTWSFVRKAQDFYRFWEPGTVLVNGEAPDSVFDEANMLDEDIALVSSDTVHFDYLIMGSVPYPVDPNQGSLSSTLGNRYSRGAYVVARVPIGFLDFTPNREELRYTKCTMETINDVQTWVAGRQLLAAQEDIEASADRSEALSRARKWTEMGLNHRFTYKGHDVPRQFPTAASVRWDGRAIANPARSRNSHYMRPDTALKALHVLGFKTSRMDPSIKAKIMHWMDDNGISMAYGDEGVVAYNFQPHEDWLPSDRVVHIDTIRAINLGTKAPARRKMGKYRQLTRSGDGLDLEELSADQKSADLVVFDSTIRNRDLRAMLGGYGQRYGATICLVTPSKRDKFFKNNPKAIDYKAWLVNEFSKVVADATPEDSFRQRNAGLLSYLPVDHADRLWDPELRWAAEFKNGASASKFDRERYQWLVRIHNNMPFTTAPVPALPSTKPLEGRFQRLSEQYPIVNQYMRNSNDMVEILNALYYARGAALVALISNNTQRKAPTP